MFTFSNYVSIIKYIYALIIVFILVKNNNVIENIYFVINLIVYKS